jgi:hypothetical protein
MTRVDLYDAMQETRYHEQYRFRETEFSGPFCASGK